LQLWIEPEPICFADTWEATVSIIKNVNADNLKINYDPSNIAWMKRNDNAEEIAEAVDLIKNVHVKDQKHSAKGSGFPNWLPVGAGEIDYLRRFEILQLNGYDGVISLEPHFPFDLAKFAACRDAVQKIWAMATANISNAESEFNASGLF
jgi:sugar phosphate isomerase/epimerase